ncbi:response regulator [Taibaiella soli]|uniref:Response regulator n=1 Tax=Taibaiella soli TaxID=1649169 RepID=A0A2W2BSV5_9BACT|nr:response regulator [Taibaiella soli]PZF70823.1 response regulator [Taibaiella soli]
MAEKILIIDDDARNIFALKATLQARKYDCIAAGSAQQGLAFLNNEKDIGVVLIDMMMPDMDGYEAIPKIKERYKVPVIAVTAQAMVGDREKCLEAGADGYVSKPIDVALLVAYLDQYLK